MYVFCVSQKTAYEMRIRDWSSDVCSSDLYRTPLINNPLDVGHPDVFQRQAQIYDENQAGQRGRTRARHHHLDAFDVFADNFQPVDEGGRNADGRTMHTGKAWRRATVSKSV